TELALGEGMVAVADMLQAEIVKDFFGSRQQAVTEDVLRSDGIPALGFRMQFGNRPYGLVSGAVGGHAPTEGGLVATDPRDFICTGGGDHDAAQAVGLFTDSQSLGRQNAANVIVAVALLEG